MNEYYKNLKTLEDIVRVLSKLKKKYPSSTVHHITNNSLISIIAIAYHLKTEDKELLKDENLLTPEEYKQITNKQDYEVLIITG